jgi:hypothetical protein
MRGAMLRFDLQQGFPAVTTKKLAFKSAIGEMIGFLRASRSAADFRELGCKVWDANANANPQWLANPYREGPDDLGGVYGVQWRQWPAYKVLAEDASARIEDARSRGYRIVTRFEEDGAPKVLLYKAIDQLRQCLDTIMRNPTDRRILFHGWNPAVLGNRTACVPLALSVHPERRAPRDLALPLYPQQRRRARHAVQSRRRCRAADTDRQADRLYPALVHVLHRRRSHLRKSARDARAATRTHAVRESDAFDRRARTVVRRNRALRARVARKSRAIRFFARRLSTSRAVDRAHGRLTFSIDGRAARLESWRYARSERSPLRGRSGLLHFVCSVFESALMAVLVALHLRVLRLVRLRLRLRLRPRLFDVGLGLRPRLFEMGLRLRLWPRLFHARLRLRLRPRLFDVGLGLRPRLFEMGLRLRLWPRLFHARLRLRPRLFETSLGLRPRLFDVRLRLRPGLFEARLRLWLRSGLHTLRRRRFGAGLRRGLRPLRAGLHAWLGHMRRCLRLGTRPRSRHGHRRLRTVFRCALRAYRLLR